jgi:peptidoglycan-associated lipoprotein
MFNARRMLILLIAVVATGALARAQTGAPKSNGVSLAITYDALGSNITNTNRFWMQGGAAELTGSFFHGFGATASVLGLHTANSGGGVPVNLVIATFGPSYHYGRRRVGVFAHGLVGEADGFRGVYPQAGGATPSASSLAVVAGGGVDVGVSRHLAVRVVQADYVRTQLPNSLTNVQNSVRLGVGIVIR